MYTKISKPSIEGKYTPYLYYRDYRYLQDDKRVLKNPHKGWYWHFIDNSCLKPQYRESSVIGNDDFLDFPCLNHLYLRFDWGDIEKEKGVFDWEYIDSVFKKWGDLGYKFTIRPCCYEGGTVQYATPEWVRLAGAKGTFCAGNAWEPDYGDKIFLSALEDFLKECSRKFNGNPLVEFVDVGSYGTWGEGHTGWGTGVSYPTAVIKKHIDLFLKYFPDTFVIINDDHINASANENGTGKQYLLDYCVGKGLGFRDDSILCECYTSTDRFGYNTVRTPFMFDRFYEQAPVDIESEHYHQISDDIFKDGFPLVEALRRTHATYCGFHGYPRPYLEKHRNLVEYVANRLGYWYFINGIEIPECVSGLPSMFKLYFENKGFCHAYNSYDFKVKLIGDNGEYTVFCGNGINLTLSAESEKAVTVKADFAGVPAGDYTLAVGMFEGETPIKLGFKKECLTSDGFYGIDSLTVSEASI